MNRMFCGVLLAISLAVTAEARADVFTDEQARVSGLTTEALVAELAGIDGVPIIDQAMGGAHYKLWWDAVAQAVAIERDGQAGAVTMEGTRFSASFTGVERPISGKLTYDSAKSLVFLTILPTGEPTTRLCESVVDGRVMLDGPATVTKCCCLSPTEQRKYGKSDMTAQGPLEAEPAGDIGAAERGKDSAAYMIEPGRDQEVCNDDKNSPCDKEQSCGYTPEGAKYYCKWLTFKTGNDGCGTGASLPLAAFVGTSLLRPLVSHRRR